VENLKIELWRIPEERWWRILENSVRQWRIPEMGKSGRNREKVGLLIWREHDR
jgi:hypothetical protein